MIKIILILIVFMLGLYFITNNCYTFKEPYSNSQDNPENRCPNMLIERENNYYLYNNKLAIVPGVNPIQFKTLEEYVEFIEWQRGQGINCPVIQLQYSTDPQNNALYKVKPNIFDSQGGLPDTNSKDNTPQGLYSNDRSEIFDANMDDPPFNQGRVGYDPMNQYIGLDTPIDDIQATGAKSPNPMDTNWGGAAYTQQAIDSGQFVGSYVTKPSVISMPNHNPALLAPTPVSSNVLTTSSSSDSSTPQMYYSSQMQFGQTISTSAPSNGSSNDSSNGSSSGSSNGANYGSSTPNSVSSLIGNV